MYESIEEVLEELDKILKHVEDTNFIDDRFHVALEIGYQFHEELRTSKDDDPL